MGNKEFKPVTVSYEDAVKRVTQHELRRLKEAYRRACIGHSMNLDTFIREVVGPGVPHSVAEEIFSAFSSNGKTLSFKELLCGLVLFTRAKEQGEEKIKFLFGLYADADLYIHKEVIDEAILKTDGQIPDSLSELFEHTDKVDYQMFKRWMFNYPEFTSLSCWLILEPCSNCTLTVDSELPSFYQTLAGVTHLEENEILYLEGKYNKLRSTSASGRFDIELFRRLVSPPLPQTLTDSLYKAFDENRDGHVDFKEMVCGLSACCKGPEVERHKFCFRVFDLDQDGYLSKAELIGAIEASFTVLQQSDHSDTVADLLEMDAYTMAGEIIESHGDHKEGRLTQEEFLIWSFQSKVPQGFAELLFEVCHVILGMKPSSRDNEGKVVKGWLSRELKRGYQLGQTWYLVSSTWWRLWQDYVSDNVVLEAIELDNTFDAVQSTNDPYERRYNDRPHGDNTKLLHPPRPGPITNSSLILSNQHNKMSSWTNEGGILKQKIQQGKDYEVVPELLWVALHSWYGGELQLPRPVIIPRNTEDKTAILELHSLHVKLFKHQAPHQVPHQPITTVAGVTGGIANFAMNVAGMQNTSIKRVQASTACFSHQHSLKQITDFIAQRLKVSRDDLRLWRSSTENDWDLLEGEDNLLEDMLTKDNQSVLMEVRNNDLTWPEEMLQLVKQQQTRDHAQGKPGAGETRVEPGTTGLSNLGNTCFMNSAIQCVSNCKPLSDYFLKEIHLYELNRNNPLGMKGRLAQLYGKLITSLWDGTNRNLPPVELRYTLAKYAPQFNGCQQHDAQELLAFLLDGLHEDLNRVQNKPYVELKDSNGRRDEIVAREGWDYHLLRNRSIIVDLFHGQLKSLVRCNTCSHTSVRFDPFTYLSLPLPMENSLMIEVIVLTKNGARPIKYGIKLNSDDKYRDIRKPLSKYTEIDEDRLLFIELNGSHVKTFPMDSQKIKQRIGSLQPLYAYEMQHPIPPEPAETTSEPTANGSALRNGSGALPNGNGLPHMNGSIPNGKSPSNGNLPNKKQSSPAMNGRPSNQSFSNSLGRGSKANSMASSQSSSTSNLMNTSIDSLRTEASKPDGLVVAVHRKLERKEFYFLAPRQSIPYVFGLPVVFQTTDTTTHKDMYHCVWTMIKRFVTGHPVTERCNHAQDCDGSLGNEYPFQLIMTKRCGSICTKCPYYKFCRGCLIDYTDELFESKSEYVAIDWDPTAYYLRYQASTETVHSSVTEVYNSDDPVNIQKCLESFTREEQLAEDELYYCSKCKQHRMATKKLEIWRLPPVLIIHLKRFQFLSNRWVKSQKLVDFPLKDFDPEQYLAPRSLAEEYRRENSFSFSEPGTPGTPSQAGDFMPPMVNGSMASMCNYLEGSDVHETRSQSRPPPRTKAPSITSFDSLDYSQTKYDLYALSCHRGNIGGGHYVACTKNANNDKWYEYNDSMVKEMQESSVAALNQRNSYILFYKRKGYNFEALMPDVGGKTRDDKGLDDEFHSELSKAASCCIQ